MKANNHQYLRYIAAAKMYSHRFSPVSRVVAIYR